MRKRSRLRPPRVLSATRAGWCFIAIIFGVGFAALNTGNNLLYLILALMLAFLVLSGILSETSLRGIRIERALPRELFACSANRVVLRVHNDQRRNASFAITIEDRLESPAGLDPAGRTFALRVAPRSSMDLSYVFEPESRGDIQFAGFRVSTRFPFGLFRKSRDLEEVESAIVYPPVQRLCIDARTDASSTEHEASSARSPDGDEIAGLREFVSGDSHARVHWRSSIRAGRLLVGEREGLADTKFEVQLRLPPSASDKLVEERVARAASEVVTHLESGSRVGLQSKSIRFVAATGFAHRSELLTFLARVTPDAIERSGPVESPAREGSP